MEKNIDSNSAEENQQAAEALAALANLLKIQNLPRSVDSVKSAEDAIKKEFKFWKTQPVPQLEDTVIDFGPIEPANSNIQKHPYKIPDGFEWELVDVDNSTQLTELYTLLNENYVEDDDCSFRFDYSPQFLKWALKPPGFFKSWHLGVRVTNTKKLVAFISGIPATLAVDKASVIVAEINFLCVHKKLRSKRLAPVLIKEITRRVHLKGIFQAVYTAGVYLPRPLTTCRYWHRSLNPKKLIDIQFSVLQRNMTMARTIKLYKLPDHPTIPGSRPMLKEDIPQVYQLLQNSLARYSVHPNFHNEADISHWFMTRQDVIYSFVVVDSTTQKITDFFSFYILNSTVCNHPTHKTLYAAYSYYLASTKVPYSELLNESLILAKQKGCDVFNCLDLMENAEALKGLKFGIGDGELHYYMYNYKTPLLTPQQLGLVLL